MYSIADMCLLTSTRDGMNLVAFEYVACQDEHNGVLVLSEFAGAAAFMAEGSIQFHPANMKEMAQAMNRALTMSKEERKSRHLKLKEFVNSNTRYAPG